MKFLPRVALPSALLAISIAMAQESPAPQKPPPREPTDASTVMDNSAMPERGMRREGQVKALAKTQKDVQLVFIGDSITEFYNPVVFATYYARYHALSCGFMGENTENILTHINNGMLDGLSPKVVVLLIGANNLGHIPSEKPEWVAAGIKAIVDLLHQKLPNSKVLVMGVFPRGKTTTDPLRVKVAAVNKIISALDDGKATRFIDIGPKFVTADGSLPQTLLRDGLHPTPKGDQLWADSIQPLLDEMMGITPSAPAKVWPAPAVALTLQNADPDDGSIFCNHIPLPGLIADVRCRNPVTAGKIMLFARGAKPSIDLPVQNDRTADIPADYTLTLATHDGTQLDQKTGSVSLASGTSTRIGYSLDTSNFKYGVYSLNLNVTAAGKPLTQREYYFGVISNTVIPKSPDSAGFLYGLDPNFGGVIAMDPVLPDATHPHFIPGQCDLLPWIDAMGVDIVRCAGCMINFTDQYHKERQDWPTSVMPTLRQHGLRVMGMVGPPEPDPRLPAGFAPEDLKKWDAFLTDMSARAPDITYWEIGNEPDLGYPGVDRYVQMYEEVYHAIKKGNPKTIIFNGAITYFGATGPKNSDRIIKTIKPDCIDAVAYHAHGQGSLQEKRVYDLTRKAADESGKADKPLVDTETGMFVGSRRQEDTQANMVVQKQVYGQSVGDKFLMTFRLHAFRSETGWGLLRTDFEPQPAILAYRAMTEHLKGLAWQKTLELGKEYAEGYAFAQPAGPARACVLWSDQPAFYNVYLKVAPSANEAENIRMMDIYGNESPADVSEDGVARVEVTETPTYLLWNAVDLKAPVSVTKSMLQTPDMATVVPDGTIPLSFKVVNSSNADITGTLSAAINMQGQAATITPAEQTLTIPAMKSVPVELSVKCTRQQQGLVWPQTWTVYTGVKDSDVNFDSLRDVPATIGGVAGRTVQQTGGAIVLLPPGQLPHEKQPGYAFASIQSDRDQVVRIGCAADWWMEFRLNGDLVCSTLDKGNAFLFPVDRILELHLKKGANLMAFKVLSGKQGWNIGLISPGDLPGVQDPRNATNCIDLSLEAGGKKVARERLAIQPVQRVASIGDLKWTDPKDKWTSVKADFTSDTANITNLYDKQQDRTKWWQGPNDLSANAWLRSDGQRLYLIVWVLDDNDVTGTDPAKLSDSDSLQVGLSKDVGDASPDRKPAFDLYSVGRINGSTVVYKEASSQGLAQGLVDASAGEVNAHVERIGPGTLYRVSLDRALVGDGVFRLNFLVNDNDDGYRKQYLQWTGGLGDSQNPSLWQQFIP
jgi:beta-glucosidase